MSQRVTQDPIPYIGLAESTLRKAVDSLDPLKSEIPDEVAERFVETFTYLHTSKDIMSLLVRHRDAENKELEGNLQRQIQAKNELVGRLAEKDREIDELRKQLRKKEEEETKDKEEERASPQPDSKRKRDADAAEEWSVCSNGDEYRRRLLTAEDPNNPGCPLVYHNGPKQRIRCTYCYEITWDFTMNHGQCPPCSGEFTGGPLSGHTLPGAAERIAARRAANIAAWVELRSAH